VGSVATVMFRFPPKMAQPASSKDKKIPHTKDK
jgi:hypothetical protein